MILSRLKIGLWRLINIGCDKLLHRHIPTKALREKNNAN